MKIRIAPGGYAPTRANPTDAGLDLRACNDYIIQPSEVVLVDTGVSVDMGDNYDSRSGNVASNMVGLLFQRSGMVKSGLQMANCVGVIDYTYRGTIKAAIRNMNEEQTVTVARGDRIAQLVFLPIYLPRLELFEGSEESWNESTARGTGGFGSTGR